jgi:hypothetical protein
VEELLDGRVIAPKHAWGGELANVQRWFKIDTGKISRISSGASILFAPLSMSLPFMIP